MGVGTGARGDASVHGHDRVHPFRGPAPGSGGPVVRRGGARGEADAPRRKDIQSHRETSPRGDSRAETKGGARVASPASRRGGEAAVGVAAGEVRRRLPSPKAAGRVLRARPRRRYEKRPCRVDRGNPARLAGEAWFSFSFFVFFVFRVSPKPSDPFRRRPSIAQATGNRASSRRTTATPGNRNCPGTRPWRKCTWVAFSRAPRMATAGRA